MIVKTYKGVSLTHETNAWATHQPILIWALENSTGDVLELGAGENSTLLIEKIVENTQRKILTVEDDSSWLQKYLHMKSENHDFKAIDPSIEEWTKLIDACSEQKWGVVFVDQAQIEKVWRYARPYSVKKLVHCAEYVVAHDADLFPEMKGEGYFCAEWIPKFQPMPYRRGPSTWIFSSKNKLDEISIPEGALIPQ